MKGAPDDVMWCRRFFRTSFWVRAFCLTSPEHLNKRYCLIANYTPGMYHITKFHSNFKRFHSRKRFDKCLYKIVTILFGPQFVLVLKPGKWSHCFDWWYAGSVCRQDISNRATAQYKMVESSPSVKRLSVCSWASRGIFKLLWMNNSALSENMRP